MKKLSLLFILSLILCSCSINEEEEILLGLEEEEIETASVITEDNDSTNEDSSPFETSCTSCADSAVYDPYFTGTACCVSNMTEFKLNEPVIFRYVTNREIIAVDWIVTSDNIEILAINEVFITVKFNDNFTEGIIQGNGVHATHGVICGARVVVTYND